MKTSPILITGAARSGTSMVAGAINLCGAFGGDMSGPNRNNKKGMFENHEIRQSIVKPYLHDIGADKMGQYPLPDINNLWIPRNWAARVREVFRLQGYTDGPWMYKGAKMCLIWPVWHYAFPDAKWVVVRRRGGDIARSCCRTAFMRAFNRTDVQRKVNAKDEFSGWVWWVHQHEQRFVEMIEAGLNVTQIWPERMVTGNYEQLYNTLDWLGLKWNSEVLNFIDPKLWKSRRK